jgi:hypothetical protein
MHDLPFRMAGLHHLLTGGPRQPSWRSTYPPRYLWGDIGLPEERAPAPRRSFSRRIFRWVMRAGR